MEVINKIKSPIPRLKSTKHDFKAMNKLYADAISIVTGVAILSDFNIKDNYKDRVYFKSTVKLQNIDINSFVISKKIISGISIDGDGLGGYFVVNTAFDFWDNNTIRKEGGDSTIYDFTMEHIVNNIVEPDATNNTYYVDVSATGTGDGLSEINAFTTIQPALDVATGGSTIYVKAGTYVPIDHGELKQSGTAILPIKIIGYKSSPDDISTMYYNYTHGVTAPALDPAEMPFIAGGDLRKYGLWSNSKNYYIIKNIQMERLLSGILAKNSDAIVIENCITKNMYGDGTEEASGFLLDGTFSPTEYTSGRFRVKNSIAINAGGVNVGISSKNSLVINTKTYCDHPDGSGVYGSDYHIAITGDHNIVYNCEIGAIVGVNTSSHGYSIRGADLIGESDGGTTTSYNLVANSIATGNFGQGCQARNFGTDYNVFKDLELNGTTNVGSAIMMQTGAKFNIWERIKATGFQNSIFMHTGTESGTDPANLITEGNIIRNSLLTGASRVLQTANSSDGQVAIEYSNNKFQHLTIANSFDFYEESNTINYTATGNEFINCIIIDIPDENRTAGGIELEDIASFTNCNFFNTFTVPVWMGSQSTFDPQIVGDYIVTNALLNIGINLLDYDYNKLKRRTDNTTTLGHIQIPNP